MAFVAAFGAVALAGGVAQAQNITLVTQGLTRPKTEHEDNNGTYKYYVSRKDCLDAKDIIEFPFTVTNFDNSTSLEVWVSESGDCTDVNNRPGVNMLCRRVDVPSTIAAYPNPTVVKIPSKKIVEALNIADCGQTSETGARRKATLYFLLVRSGINPTPQADQYIWKNTQVDLWGPAPPTSLKVGSAENSLEVGFKPVSSGGTTDVYGYRVYCDDGKGFLGSGSAQPGGAGGAGGTGGAGGGGGGGGGATTGAGGAGSGSASSGCPSGISLEANVLPDPSWRVCGEVLGNTANAVTAKGPSGEKLQNGVDYAVAIAAVDDLRNPGPLSQVACGAPVLLTDFFEYYRSQGGKGGGGICSLSVRPAERSATALLGLAGLTALGLVLRRRVRANDEVGR